MSPIQQMFLGVGAVATKTYVDEVFSNYVYRGSSSAQTFDAGVDLANEGGFIWSKYRTMNSPGIIFDTERGKTKFLRTTEGDAEGTSNTSITSFNNNGFSVGGGDGWTNYNDSYTFATWIWRKAPGFCDIVTYAGNDTAGRQISHSLGSVPGLILVKKTTGSSGWQVYHRSLGATKYLRLNTNAAAGTASNRWDDTEPTATHFTLGSTHVVNNNGDSYVAYVFAGGASTAATARSVDFESSSSHWIYSDSTSSDFTMGTGDFTVECWCRLESANEGGLFQISSGSQGFNNTKAGTIAIAANPHSSNDYEGRWDIYSGSGDTTATTGINLDVWYHLAYVRSSGVSKLYVNGTQRISITDTTDYSGNRIAIGRAAGNYFDGEISNLRVVKGTAVYTSSFKPPTEPLANITNTKLLCLNNSSITGTSVSPSTLTTSGGGTIAASTDSPFDDPAGFKFGDAGDQNIIKTGSFKTDGNGEATVNIGWEPSFVMMKRSDGGAGWYMFDSIRGFPVDGDSERLSADDAGTVSEMSNYNVVPSSGFSVNGINTNSTHVFIAVRRPDGYVGKPIELGTNAFAMDYGSGSSNIPTFDSGFPVDFGLGKDYGGTDPWNVGSRFMGPKRLSTSNQESESGQPAYAWDSNVGLGKSFSSSHIQWMFKRHAGMDAVTYQGNSPGYGTNPMQIIPHSLNKVPELILVKARSKTNGQSFNQPWAVYVSSQGAGKYFDGIASGAISTGDTRFGGVEPTSTHFNVGTSADVNGEYKNYIAFLFASVDGISKVGSYTGNATDSDHSSGTNTITFGFQPRMVIIKTVDASGREWVIFDTLRGWASGSGNTKRLRLNLTNAQNNENFGYPTSTGMVLTGNGSSLTNNSGDTYIYYAHA